MAHSECTACSLHKGASRMVFADGNPDARIHVVLVGEGPGPDEDREGVPWVGKAGQLLMRLLSDVGWSRDDVYLTNVVKCFPSERGKIRKPSDAEVATCMATWTVPELAALQPIAVLVPIGAVATAAILGRAVTMSDARGKVLTSQYCDKVIPVFHPSFILGQGSPTALLEQARGDFALIKAVADAVAAGLSAVDVAEKAVDAKSIQLRKEETDQFEQRIIVAEPWNATRKYYAGWSDGMDIVMLYRDEDGARRRERVTGFEWYFYMRTDDVLRVPLSLWERARTSGIFKRLEVDARSDDWTRVYAKRVIVQSRWLIDRGEIGVGLNILDDPRQKQMNDAMARAVSNGGERKDRKAAWQIASDQRRAMMSHNTATKIMRADGRTGHYQVGNWAKYADERNLHDFLLELHKIGPSYEADLTPRQRFMTDHFVQVDDHYNELFFDIETDDSIPGWDKKEEWRHLSYAAIMKRRDGTVERYSFILHEETDRAEAAMLRAFMKVVDEADVLYAWNGFNFDFPILRARARKYRIEIDWRHVVWTDLLSVWRRYHTRGASSVTSYALGELAPKILQREKLDWRDESRKLGDPVGRIIDLYRRHPDLLQKYNERDAELLFGLEEELGYAKVDRVFCRIGNCFPNDFHISTKVDMLLLNKGARLGHHFITRGLQFETLPAYIATMQKETVRHLGVQGEVDTVATGAVGRLKGGKSEYTGAFVFPSVVGYHEGVAALDFKSLYPTVMMLFNISPETWVSREDAGTRVPLTELTLSPSGAYFRKADTGLIPLVFRETMEKRKVYTKLQLAEDVGSRRFLLYYRLSYAYKRLGLSFYGELGNETSRYFNPEVAEAVTLGGQWLIKKSAEFAEQHGYRVLAGDTDSLYLKMTQAQAEVFVQKCDGYYREIVKPFNVDMTRFAVELEYENYFRNIIFVKKKRYAGKMTIFKGKVSDYLEVKGLECMRSDGIEYERAFQRTVLDFILSHGRPAVSKIVALIIAAREEVYAGKLGVEDIVNTQSMEKSVDDYKTTPPHVRVARYIRSVSTEYFIGMKVPYVMVMRPGEDAKGRSKPTLDAVWAREYTEGTYDPDYVWLKKTYPATMRVLAAAYPEYDWEQYLAPPPGAASYEMFNKKVALATARAVKKQDVARKSSKVKAGVIILRKPVNEAVAVVSH